MLFKNLLSSVDWQNVWATLLCSLDAPRLNTYAWNLRAFSKYFSVSKCKSIVWIQKTWNIVYKSNRLLLWHFYNSTSLQYTRSVGSRSEGWSCRFRGGFMGQNPFPSQFCEKILFRIAWKLFCDKREFLRNW